MFFSVKYICQVLILPETLPVKHTTANATTRNTENNILTSTKIFIGVNVNRCIDHLRLTTRTSYLVIELYV